MKLYITKTGAFAIYINLILNQKYILSNTIQRKNTSHMVDYNITLINEFLGIDLKESKKQSDN